MKIIILLLVAMLSSQTTEQYPRTMIVVEIDNETDLVTLEDNVGYNWQFYGVEDWMEGDICSCIMDDNGTEAITDDSIVMTRYNGTINK